MPDNRVINLKEAIDGLETALKEIGSLDMDDVKMILGKLSYDPSEYKLDEWCDTCKEYDKEKHCCLRFNKVIRRTVKEFKESHK